MIALPYPVPPAVVTEADALGGTAEGLGKSSSNPTFVLQILGANFEVIHSSPKLTGSQLKVYVYGFNFAVNPLKWRMRLVLEWTYLGKLYRFTKTFVVPVNTTSPKGRGVRVTVRGGELSVTASAIALRRRLALAVKRKSPEELGYSSSRPIRPNESETESVTKFNWLRFGHTGAWMVGAPENVPYTSRSRVWTGVRTPGFGGYRAKRLPVNPHTVSMRKTVMGFSAFGSHNLANGNNSGLKTIHTQFYPGATTPTHLASADTAALKRLLDAAGLEGQNLAETVATMGQTSDMILGNLRKIAGTLKALRRGNMPEAIRQLWGNANPRYRRRSKGPSAGRDLASNWLELQYGWKPLINDVHWAMQKLSKENLAGFQVVRTAASAKKKDRVVSDVLMHIASPGKAGSRIIETHSTVRYVVYWTYHSHLLSLLSQAGFTNPVSLTWELLPFSFVVDWFLPIGPYFEQLSAWSGLIFLGGSKTQFTRQWTDFALNYDRVSPLNANQRDWGVSQYHDEWIVLERTKLNSFPSAQVPSVRNGLANLTRVANGVALLRQLVK